MPTWEDSAINEKFDSLRRDVTRIFVAYQDLNRRVSALAEHLTRVERIALKAVEAAEER
jgi:hypothetical protein